MDWLLKATTIPEKFGVMIIAIVLFAAVMAAILFLVGTPRRMPNWIVAAGFLIPTLLAIGFGLLYPAIVTMVSSLRSADGSKWTGFSNFVTAFTDPQFQQVLLNTVAWVILVPLLSTGIGLVYAVLVDRARIEKLAKTLIFMPMAISGVAAGVIWKFMYDYRQVGTGRQYRPQIGFLNAVLEWLHLTPVNFIQDPPANTLWLLLVMVWIQTGFAMTVLSASIKAIPDDIVEAARLDGAGGWRMFRSITVPFLRASLVVVITTIAMATLKAFDIVRTMTGGNYQTSVVANEFYLQYFSFQDQGIGSALAVILFIAVIPIVIYNVRQLRRSGDMG